MQLRDAAKTLSELWNLMDSSEEERQPFEVATNMLGHSEVDAACSGVLSIETIKQVCELYSDMCSDVAR